MEWLVSWKKPSSETEGRAVDREELRSGKGITEGEVVVVASEERRRSNRGVLERVGGRRWRRRERRSVAAESEVEVKLGVGGGADVVPFTVGNSC